MTPEQIKPVSKAAAAYDSLRRSIVRGVLVLLLVSVLIPILS
ncbi:hypothetical protein [Citricoccus sp. NR2]|nr:hypothetical protein [Citricoccus sp. NR2]WBL18600.1 hypothetical protein O1A05_12680 [Citricoccus sp. NR2]